MNVKLSGKTAIVTGSTSGIGWSCANSLAACGASVVLVARDEQALKASQTGLQQSAKGTAQVRYVVADLTTAEGCKHLMTAEPRCDILVNNLGAYSPKDFFESSDQDWLDQFTVNVMPGVRLGRHYLKTMMESGWGRVVFLSSVDALIVPTDSLQYGVTKAGVLALSRGLAKLAANSGVTVNAVLPGPTDVEWLHASLEQASEKAGASFQETAHQAVVQRYPSSLRQNLLQPQEVANLVVYLCSNFSSATSGSALRADGGILEGIA